MQLSRHIYDFEVIAQEQAKIVRKLMLMSYSAVEHKLRGHMVYT